ncbi:MAG: hypothetical protein EHM59_07725 [Betaproteobacteria bacterium]|nr:MAG: hypothetical protein EHM59_07725 [Betaproteobacteria bacterium]
MNTFRIRPIILALGASALAAAWSGIAIADKDIAEWQVVVNNGVTVPGDSRTFNSYNQPSVNVDALVVFRARSRGGQGGEPAHGVYTRDMSKKGGGPVTTVFDRNTLVPAPNNLGTTFTEPPSFPRIDIRTHTVASRGNHSPVWRFIVGTDPVTGEEIESRAGTTGLYATAFGPLVTGESNLGAVPEFSFFAVPGRDPQTKFDVFPGAPAVTDGSILVFKANHTENGIGKTGVYFRRLENQPIPSSAGPLSPAAGTQPAVMIADNVSTLIPGTGTLFGSTAPPSAAEGKAVFAGFDNEDNPTLGGIYLAALTGTAPPLTALVSIQGQVPGESPGVGFTRLGEGVSFDGRFVAFWGAWDTATKQLVLQCPTEGNRLVIAFCREQHPNGYTVEVPVNQGIFVHDIETGETHAIAKTPADFSDFVYMNYSGRVPGLGEGEEDGELARWRSASFVAVSGVRKNPKDKNFQVAFKGRRGEVVNGVYVDPIDGIYLYASPKRPTLVALAETGMAGTIFDPQAVADSDEDPATPPTVLPVTEVGIERDGFRGNVLVINVSMGTEEAGWAGIYLTQVKK